MTIEVQIYLIAFQLWVIWVAYTAGRIIGFRRGADCVLATMQREFAILIANMKKDAV